MVQLFGLGIKEVEVGEEFNLQEEREAPVIDLAQAPGERKAWGKPAAVVYLWGIMELLFVSNPLQISSGIRVRVLRLFGAKIGQGVIFRPRTRVKFPWNLEIGDRCWIGEGVWFHNQDIISIGHDVVISQETFITNGSHAVRKDMALVTLPIRIEDGVWVTSRCMLMGGTVIGTSAVIGPGTVLQGEVPSNVILNAPARPHTFQRRTRFVN